jgi:hypothetical protein
MLVYSKCEKDKSVIIIIYRESVYESFHMIEQLDNKIIYSSIHSHYQSIQSMK